MLYRGIAPKLLEIVSCACVREKHMHHGIAIVNHDPFRILIAVVVVRFSARVFKQIFADAVGNGAYLHGACALADNEMGSGGAFVGGEVNVGDLPAFALLDTFGDESNYVGVVSHISDE